MIVKYNEYAVDYTTLGRNILNLNLTPKANL